MDELVELRQYLAMVRKWWWLMILGAAAAASIGFGVSQAQPRMYEAVTTLIVGQAIQSSAPDSKDIQTSGQLALTYAVIVRRQPV